MSDDLGLRQYIAMLEQRASELRGQLDEIQVALKHARKTVGEYTNKIQLPMPDADEAEGEPKKDGGPYTGKGVEESALEYLRTVQRTQKTAQVADALLEGGIETEAKNFSSTVFGSLRRLVEKGQVEKVGAGKWRALEAKSDIPPWLDKG